MAATAGEQAWKTGDFQCEKCHEKVYVRQCDRIRRCPNCGNDTYDTRLNEPSNR